MSSPSTNELFMNLWVTRMNSDEQQKPGSEDWDGRSQRRYWAKVWLDCKELSQHLERIENVLETMRDEMRAEDDYVTDSQVMAVLDEPLPEEK